MKQAWILSRPDRVGDVIASTACIQPIKKQFPELELSFIVAEPMLPLLQGHPDISSLIALPESEDLDAAYSFEAACRALGASALVELNGHPVLARMAERVEFFRHIRYRRHCLDFDSDAVKDTRRLGLQHEAAASFDLLVKLGCERPDELLPSLPNYNEAWHRLKTKYPLLGEAPYAVYNLTVFGDKPRWPVQYFAALATQLANERGWAPLLIGASKNDSVYAQFNYLYQGKCSVLDFVEKTDLAELGALLEQAALLVSRDTGPAHLGAAVGCPTIALMSAHPVHCARRWQPLGRQVYVIEQPLLRKRFGESRRVWWARVFEQITVSQVLDGVAALNL